MDAGVVAPYPRRCWGRRRSFLARPTLLDLRRREPMRHAASASATRGGDVCYMRHRRLLQGAATSATSASTAATIGGGCCYTRRPRLLQGSPTAATRRRFATSGGGHCYQRRRRLLHTGRRRAARRPATPTVIFFKWRRALLRAAAVVATKRTPSCCKESGEADGEAKCDRRRTLLRARDSGAAWAVVLPAGTELLPARAAVLPARCCKPDATSSVFVFCRRCC